MTKEQEFTVVQIAEALRKNGGFKTYAAKSLGCTYQTIVNYFNRYPELHKILDEINNRELDISEHMLLKLRKKGDFKAVKFHLNCKGKARGYVERTELTGPDGEAFKPMLLVLPEIDEAQERFQEQQKPKKIKGKGKKK